MNGACIITYNPDIIRLKENIQAIVPQVDGIVVVDNGSRNIEDIKTLCEEYKTCYLFENHENKGIAAALNRGMKYLYHKGYEWAVSLDQDSVCPPDLIQHYLQYTDIKSVGMISPTIVDRNAIDRDRKKILQKESYETCDWCITSGAFTNLEALKKAGWFDRSLFIDLVDYDVCLRIKKKGYKILRLKNTYLLHQVGNMEPKKILFKSISVWNHSSIRRYYYFRNCVYIARKYHNKKIAFECMKSWWIMMGKVILYEKDKAAKLKMLYKGTLDGLQGRMGKIKG